MFEAVPDSLAAWMDRYQALAVAGVRSEEVAAKIALHLAQFRLFLAEAYGHNRISAVTRRDVAAWQRQLAGERAAATVNNHVASLSGFTSWVAAQAPGVFAAGDPAKGLSGLALPPLEPRALSRHRWGRDIRVVRDALSEAELVVVRAARAARGPGPT